MIEGKKRFLNSYLFLMSGIQMLLSISYCFKFSQGKGDYVSHHMTQTTFRLFVYSTSSFFVNGLLYHCLSKPLFRGGYPSALSFFNSKGFPLAHFFVLINTNQFVSLLFFFMSHFTSSNICFYFFFQFLEYLATFLLGSFLNYYCLLYPAPNMFTARFHNQHNHHSNGSNHSNRNQSHDNDENNLNNHSNSNANNNSNLMSRESMQLFIKRRDWGISATLFSAFEAVLLFSSFIQYTFTDREAGFKKYGSYLNFYCLSLFLVITGSLGIHFLSLKIAKGHFGCHQKLYRYHRIFVYCETIGMIIYVLTSVFSGRTKIFFWHSFFIGFGTSISAIGCLNVSKLKFQEEIKLFEMSNDTIPNEVNEESLPTQQFHSV
ncbi:hypothetical protein TRFO_10325 [Tritrichomonas foetus]|uniref:Uncharacterized protein n=1 Tax=Tritrichomonas foetus TaxID=1144522 RepID=A0A1J4JE29_9EUKA|nr:hypothetical protein TRFO_10325 [Tritrichomonas foetus]|eukprot:OHS95693.1 hypothetical protein TRFO_10325 [Tritrichomonas foetus]